MGVKEVHLQRLVFFDGDAIGHARPDQALYERMTHEDTALIEQAAALARHSVQRVRCSVGARYEPQTPRRRIAVVDVPAALDRNVLHR
jgi:hypothetical protein